MNINGLLKNIKNVFKKISTHLQNSQNTLSQQINTNLSSNLERLQSTSRNLEQNAIGIRNSILNNSSRINLYFFLYINGVWHLSYSFITGLVIYFPFSYDFVNTPIEYETGMPGEYENGTNDEISEEDSVDNCSSIETEQLKKKPCFKNVEKNLDNLILKKKNPSVFFS